MKNDKIVVGITQGDINGISYEIIIKTLLDQRMIDFCIPVVYGSPKVAAYHRKALNISNFSLNNITKADDCNPKRPNIINCCDDSIRVELGKSTTQAGEASFSALKLAVRDLQESKIDVLVTAPFNKFNMQSKDFSFPGHTEYLQAEFNVDDAIMLMVSDYLKVGVVTGHVPMVQVPELIKKDTIVSKINVLNKCLIEDFGIRKPRIAVLSLNPHSGENGMLGTEEQTEIIPAINEAKEKGYIVMGPFASDGFFGSGDFTKFDAILAMYHDQGLTPFKSLVTGGGVNFTAGLPVVRTSPAHGTAYALAGKGEASPDSFRKALFMACDIYRSRNNLKELSKNPMKSYDISSI